MAAPSRRTMVAAWITTLSCWMSIKIIPCDCFVTKRNIGQNEVNQNRYPTRIIGISAASSSSSSFALRSSNGANNNEEEEKENPYQDPEYPDLEFIDYSDPEYSVDQGLQDEFYEADDDDTDDDTPEKIEAMREERRRRNDEFQFETYFASVLNGGDEYMGEWTSYRTSTFLKEGEEGARSGGGGVMVGDVGVGGYPKLIKRREGLRVKSLGKKLFLEEGKEEKEEGWMRVDNERILHDEYAEDEEDDNDEVFKCRYWPEQLSSDDFRGPAGIMCVGNAYTICDALPLGTLQESKHDGPFTELRTEIGIQYNRMRFRVKFDYRTKTLTTTTPPPALHLYSITVCRETRAQWPRTTTTTTTKSTHQYDEPSLFGLPPGAPGGLYDPPPVGSDEQSELYMLLDLEGGATILFPHRMDQEEGVFNGNGWVTSLDWTPGRIRYQVDRKVMGGIKIKGLRTLELSEVQGADADKYRPKDGGSNMRQ